MGSTIKSGLWQRVVLLLEVLGFASCGGGGDEGARHIVDGFRVNSTVNKREAYDIGINGGGC